EAGLKEKGFQSRIHRRAARNRPLSERQKSANTTRSKVRARVEHVFGHQQSSMGGKIVRTIGIVRARFKIGMMNLGYNIRRRGHDLGRWVTWGGRGASPAWVGAGVGSVGWGANGPRGPRPGIKTVLDRGLPLA